MTTGSKIEVRPGVWRLRALRGYKANGQPIQANKTVRGTEKQAARELARLITEIADGTAPTSGAMTVEAYLNDRYLPHIKDRLGPETYRNHRSKITRRIIPALGKIRLDKLTALDLDSAYSRWQAEGELQASTIRAHHLVISSALG